MSDEARATSQALIARAEACVEQGRLEDARILLEKSLSLFDTTRATDMLQRVEARIQRGGSARPAAASPPPPRPQPQPQPQQQQQAPPPPRPQQQYQQQAPPPRPQGPAPQPNSPPPRPQPQASSSSYQQYQQQQQQQQQQQAPRPPPASNASSPRPPPAANSNSNSNSASSGASSSNSNATGGGSGDNEYTVEQQTAARRITKIKCKYEILGVAKTADDVVIKSAYRKLALRIHPDKNKAPEAEEAFKAVTAAYLTLSDPAKRRMYDMTGVDDENAYAQQQHQRRAAQGARYGPGGGFGFHQGFGGGGMHGGFEEMTPDMLFRNIFGSVFAGADAAGPRRRAQQQQQQQQGYRRGPSAAGYQQQQQQRGGGGGEGAGTSLLQMVHFLPLVLLFLFTMLNSASTSTAPQYPFSLQRAHAFPHARETAQGAPYFVNNEFKWTYGRDPRALGKFEEAVNEQFSARLQDECAAQRKAKRGKMEEARAAKDTGASERMRAAYAEKMPSCEAYDKFLSAAKKGGN